MNFRLKAFTLHLAASTCALTLILGGLYFGWYRWPGWYLTGVLRVLIIVGVVDLVVGPTLTLIVANPKKPRRALARDIMMIVTVQIAALIYGSATLWQGRPLYYTFSADSLEMVQASDIDAKEIRLAREQNPTLAPHWYSRPRWIWAPLPDNPDEAAKIVNSKVFGTGEDVVDMPRYFRPWVECTMQLRDHLRPVSEIRYLSKFEKTSLTQRFTRLGLASDQRNAMIMWGGGNRLLAVFDPQTLRIIALLAPS
jgi:hypothetical protein